MAFNAQFVADCLMANRPYVLIEHLRNLDQLFYDIIPILNYNPARHQQAANQWKTSKVLLGNILVSLGYKTSFMANCLRESVLR